MDKEMEYVVVAVFKWREQMARQYDESISFIMGKAVIFNIGYQKACTIEDIRRLYTPIPDCILERLEELRTVINNAIAEAKSVTSQSTFSTTVGSYVSNLSPSTFDPINYSNLVNFNKYNKYPPHVNFKRSLPAKPIFPFLQNMSALGVDPSFVYGTINNNTGNNNNNTGDNNNTNNGDNNSTQRNDNSNGNSNDNNENNNNNSNNGLNYSFVDYSKLAKQAVGFLDRAYQDLPINPKTANYIFGSDKVKLELPRNILSSLSPSLAVSVGSIEITSSNKTVAKQYLNYWNILKILPLKTRTQSDLQEFWGEIATINYSLLVFFLKDGDFMEIPPMFKDSALRLELQQKSNIILLSYNPPISISSDSLPISSVPCIPSPSPAIPLYSPPVAESNTPFCCTEEQTGFNLVCNNLKEGAMCGAFLCESEHLFVKDHGIHSYNPLALQFVTTLIHPDKPQFPDKLYKIHCRSCTLSVGNIMICHEPEADYIFNFKKINVMFSNKKLPENMLQPHKWMYLSRRNSEKRELPSKRVCSPPRQREVPKPVAENKIVQLQFTAVDEWFVYRLSLSDLACEHTYTHLESRKFVGFLLLSSKELFTKPFVVSRPKVSHTVSLTLFEKLKPSESQSKKITELSDSYLNLIPNVDLNIYRKNNFQILPYFSFNESLPGFQDNLDFLHKVLQLQPALPLLHNCVSSVASRHQVDITLGTLGETPSEPQSAEDIARRDAKEEILRLFQHRLFVPPRGHKWLILNFAFQKNPLSGNFQNNTFVDYYKKKGHQITDLTQPILIAGESIDSSHEYVPELVMLSGVTAEMYQVGKLLIDVVGGLQKSSGELAHLSNLQNSLGYWINDVNLLKKVFTSKVAADTNRQKESSHYEEEEFLGDSVLEFVLSYYLFLKHENAAEGELTAMAIKFKKNKKLEEVANRLGFSEYIVTANRTAVVSSQVSDAMESFIGGLFLDSGLKVATDFILDKIIEDKTFDLFKKFELPPSYKFIVEPLNKIKKFKAMEEMEEKLNYKFTTKELLMQALTHKSAFQTSLKRKQPLPLTYDRLEFLGDAIFKFIAGVHCYMLKRNSCVGNIHDARQRLITGEAQNRMADKIGVRPALIIGQSYNIDNAEKNPTGDAVEALVAAIFLETGFDPLFKGHCCKINSDNKKENQNNNNNNNNNNNQNNISQNNNNNNCCSNGGTVVTILHDLFSYVDEDE